MARGAGDDLGLQHAQLLYFSPWNQLFAYFEYVGDDFAADMAKMAADPMTQDWWKFTDPLQEPLPDRRAWRMVGHYAGSFSYRLTNEYNWEGEVVCFVLMANIAFITGAGSGIGEAIARLFAQQGAQVIIADLQSDAAERVTNSIIESGGVAYALLLDVADEIQVCKGFADVAEQYGRLDILVNNAGVSHVGTILKRALRIGSA